MASSAAEREAFLRPPPAPTRNNPPPVLPLLRLNGANDLSIGSGSGGSGNASRRTLPNVQSLQPWMLPMTPGKSNSYL
uniref:Uncharacterized protein n=1 Tax=Panagrolaimus superbus TaxID=310955 RepID=A0A914ZAU1_9BILA